jgi:hypothetical protein
VTGATAPTGDARDAQDAQSAGGEGGDIARRLAALGPFFAAGSCAADREPGAPWRPMAELLDDPGVTAARVEAVREHLGAVGRIPEQSVPIRVAASVMHLGLAARTLSPLFALAVLGRRLAPRGLRDMFWQPATPGGSMFELSFRGLDRAEPVPDAPAGIEAPAVDLAETMRPFHVSSRILLGNVASALHGAQVALSAADPRLAPRARAELARLLSGPLLADASRTTPGGRFRRRSCCLIYQARAGHRTSGGGRPGAGPGRPRRGAPSHAGDPGGVAVVEVVVSSEDDVVLATAAAGRHGGRVVGSELVVLRKVEDVVALDGVGLVPAHSIAHVMPP